MISGIWQGSHTFLVALYGPSFASDAEWERHLAVASQVRAIIGEGTTFRVMVFSDGGGPTSAQRTSIRERAERHQTRGALVTMSRLAAGIGTVMALSYPGVKIFTPHDFHRALAHVEIPHAELPSLLDHLRGANETLPLECISEVLLTLARASSAV